MAHARPFSTSTFQDLSNGIKNTSRRGVSTPTIELWSFESPGGLQVPTFGSASFILTLASKWGCNAIVAKHIWRVKPFKWPYACTCLYLCMLCVGTNLSYQSCFICKHLQSVLSVITCYVHICIISNTILMMILWIFGQKQCAFITIGRFILKTM
jgi:hypothetical protein